MGSRGLLSIGMGLVLVVLTCGCPMGIRVPDLTSMTQDYAEIMIIDNNLSVGTVTTAYHDILAEGDVITQEPLPGTWVTRGTTVNLVVSLGAAPTETTTVQVGAILPMDGLWATAGQSANVALYEALDTANAYYDSEHLQLELLTYNSSGDPATALEALKSLDAQGVRMVVGPMSSGEAAAVVDYANEHGIILISPSSTAISLALPDNLYRLIPNDTNQAKALAMLMQRQGIANVLPVYLDDVYGRDLLEAFRADIEEADSDVVALDAIAYDPTNVDYTLLAGQIADAIAGLDTASTAILLIGQDSDAAGLFKAAGLDSTLAHVKWYATDQIVRHPSIVSDVDASAFASKVKLEGFTVPCQESIPVMPIMLADAVMSNTLGTAPMPSSLSTWDALWVIGETYHANPTADAATLKTNFETVIGSTFSVFGQLSILDANGDMSVVMQSRFAMGERSNGTPGWNFAGVFIQHITLGPYITDATSFFTEESGTATIGAVLPLTGANAEDGLGALQAIYLALDQANTYYPVTEGLDIHFNVDVCDTRSDPATALAQVKALHARGVNLIVGPISSGELAAVEAYVNETGMVAISTTSTAPSLAKVDRIMRMTATDARQAKAVSRLLTYQGKTDVALLYIDDTYGVDFVEAFQAAFAGEATAIPYAADTTDFSDVLDAAERHIENAESTENAAVLVVSIQEGVQLLEQVEEGPLTTVKWYGTDGICQSRILLASEQALAAAKATSLTCSTYDVAGMRRFSPMRNALGSYLEPLLDGSAAWNEISAYDALWLATYGYATTSLDADAATLWAKISNPNGAIGLGGIYAFDANADQSTSTYAFYSVKENASGPYWKATALYRDLLYHPNDLYIIPE